ncbi:MAG: hypothetical protein H6Q36_639 [Chloroflexi bacterium]|nr:hypothetical protein [Chloroflexota bacterium]
MASSQPPRDPPSHPAIERRHSTGTPPDDPGLLTGIADVEVVEDARHPVPIERREGVFIHLYRCRICQLKWAAFSWLADPPELRVGTVACPWCRRPTPAIHERATVSNSVVYTEAELEAEVAGLVARLAPGARLMADSLVAPLDAYAGDVADRD